METHPKIVSLQLKLQLTTNCNCLDIKLLEIKPEVVTQEYKIGSIYIEITQRIHGLISSWLILMVNTNG